MHPIFAPLSDRETVLLLTTLTVGGSDDVRLFRHLPPARRSHLSGKAEVLLQMPSEQRVKFMVRELKQAIAARGLRGAERADPSWIVHGLKGERARVVAAVLMGLPPPLVRSVLRRLPQGIRKKLPRKSEVREVPGPVAMAVRQMFESRFDPMPHKTLGTFAFRDVIHLERMELFALMRDLGLIELGQAFASVGKIALLELCRRLPRDKSEELVQAVRSASHVNLPDPKSAQRFLSRVVVNFDNTEEFFQKAGLWRLAKAMLLEDEAYRRAFRQRLPRGANEVLDHFLEKAREMEDLDEAALKCLQDSVLLRVDELARRGIIGERWAQVEKTLHDPDTARRAAASLVAQRAEGTATTPGAEPDEGYGGTP
jgi:hypothetical protein